MNLFTQCFSTRFEKISDTGRGSFGRKQTQFRYLYLALSIFFFLIGAGCNGCKQQVLGDHTTDSQKEMLQVPSADVRLYMVSNFAAALEPCGCVKDQLGGVTHFASFLKGDEQKPDKAKATLLLSSGPLFYMDSKPAASFRLAQDETKAEAVARSFAQLGLVGFAPSQNELSSGTERFIELTKLSKATPLMGNISAEDLSLSGVYGSKIHSFNGIDLGLIGVGYSEKNKLTSAREYVKKAAEDLKAKGARALIVLASVGRGEAKRIADDVPELTAILVGEKEQSGDENTKTPALENLSGVLIIELGNHLQTVGVLDLWINHMKPPSFAFEDWNTKAAFSPTKNYFKYSTQEIRSDLGSDKNMQDALSAYYIKVNSDNKVMFSNRKPRPPEKGQPSYVGVDVCSTCHKAARKVWDETAHSRAYATLSSQHKEFNLDCVSCHVTGYDSPGGSTVTFNQHLQNVQCESCHGPGSEHAKNPRVAVSNRSFNQEICLACHHPPHVIHFDPTSKLADILGPGHGKNMEKQP